MGRLRRGQRRYGRLAVRAQPAPRDPGHLGGGASAWPLLGESGPIDTTFVDRMTIASMCALVELDERDVPSTAAGPDPVRPMCEGLASFAALQGLTRFSPSRIRSSPSSASERVSAASYDAFGAAATMRALAAVVAGELRTATEAANRPDDDACASSAWLMVADAARAALRDWHREAVAPSAPETNAFGDDERDQKHLHQTRARITVVWFARRDARRSISCGSRRRRVFPAATTRRTDMPWSRSSATSPRTRARTASPRSTRSPPGRSPRPPPAFPNAGTCPSVARLVAQSGRAAMCSRSEAARDAGAACLWAVLRVGEPGETNALLSDDDEEDGTDRAVDDPDDYEITFEDGSGNWEASLFEDWLSDVDPAVSNAVPKRARGSYETRPSVEGRLRLAATLARVAPGAFESKVARSPEAARRLFSHALSSGAAPRFSRFLSPARWRRVSARSSTPARPDGWMPPSSPARAACAEARRTHAEAKRDERGFRLLKGSMFSSSVRGDRFVFEPAAFFSSEKALSSEGKERALFRVRGAGDGDAAGIVPRGAARTRSRRWTRSSRTWTRRCAPRSARARDFQREALYRNARANASRPSLASRLVVLVALRLLGVFQRARWSSNRSRSSLSYMCLGTFAIST